MTAAKKILIVDDESVNRYILTYMLEKIGCNVLSAENGYEALKLFEANQFDIVFVDYFMPMMNGIEVAQKVRNISDGRKQVVFLVMTTALDSNDSLISDILMSDIDRVVLKPIDFNEMRTIVNSNQRKPLTQLNT